MFDELGGGSVAGVPEWSKGAHSRCAAKCFVGSNPTSGTFTKLRIQDRIYEWLKCVAMRIR